MALWYETFHFDSHPVHRLEGAVHQTVIPRVVFQYLEGFSMKRTSSVQLRLSLQSEVGGAWKSLGNIVVANATALEKE